MGNFLNKFFSIFSGGGKNKSVLGIDIGASSIKIVQIKNKGGRAVLQTYGEIALGPYAEKNIGQATKLQVDKITEALTDLINESNVTTNQSAISIPMRSSMVSVFKMPELKEKQLEQMVPIEARKYIPVPISEVALDWFIVPTHGDDDEDKKFVEAMVVAIHNDVLSSYNQIVQSSKVDASFFEVEMFSTARAVLDTTYNMPVMVIDIGAGATKIYITERGVVRDSHLISKGSQDITRNISVSLGISFDYAEKLKRNFGRNKSDQDEKIKNAIENIMNPILSDANSTLLNFQKKYSKNVPRAVFVGGGSLLNGLDGLAQKRLGVEVVMGNPFEKVEVPAFLMEVLKETGLSFTVAIGIALRRLQELE
ncbi:type IV pilus assembly protein PilM [Candidatus Parcubacteria bacterium]|nr:type IV pilus assembly protein PilM [Candidatus Parcubacteria bacterium]